MANELKTITALPDGTPADNDVVPFVDLATNTTKKALKSELKGDAGLAATADAGTTTTLAAGQNATVTNVGTTSDAIFDFAIPQGIQGITGATGAKVTSVAFSGNDIVFTLDDSSTVTLTNAKIDLKGDKGDNGSDGTNGVDGAVIVSGAFSGDDLVFTLSDSSTATVIGAKTDLRGIQGIQGIPGATGNGISNISLISTVGLVKTYRITYTDSTTFDYTVTDGENGTNGIDGIDGTSFTWKGAYAGGTAYVKNDNVSYNGSSYIAKSNTTGNLPTNATYWDLLAEKGADGSGAGDMLASVYDADGGAKQVAFKDQLHNAVTVTDTAEIDMTLTGQDIKADIKTASIAKSKLDSGVQTSLGKADSAIQDISGKQDNLGFTPEDVANKKTSITDSDTDYPTGKAVKTALDGKQATGSYEVTTNKETSALDTSTTKYPCNNVVKSAVDAKASLTGTETLTNKRINPRLVTAASYTTDTGTSLDVSTCDQFEITAQAGALLFNAPGGTPLGGQKLIIRIKDNGTARALTYNAIFRALGNALPTTTVLSKTLYMGFIYNATDTKWDLVAVAQEA